MFRQIAVLLLLLCWSGGANAQPGKRNPKAFVRVLAAESRDFGGSDHATLYNWRMRSQSVRQVSLRLLRVEGGHVSPLYAKTVAWKKAAAHSWRLKMLQKGYPEEGGGPTKLTSGLVMTFDEEPDKNTVSGSGESLVAEAKTTFGMLSTSPADDLPANKNNVLFFAEAFGEPVNGKYPGPGIEGDGLVKDIVPETVVSAAGDPLSNCVKASLRNKGVTLLVLTLSWQPATQSKPKP